MLKSFFGAMGSLMGESGLADVMNAGFSGVGKMLNGKKFPQNVRALRIIVEELLGKDHPGQQSGKLLTYVALR